LKVLCVLGEHQYGDPSRGLGTEYAAFIPALRKQGHQVLHFESWNKQIYHDYAELNSKLLDVVESFRPDVMLTVHMEYELWLETLENIRARGDVATISWAADDSWKYREVSRFIGGAYHAMTTTYDYVVPRYHADGIQHVLLTQWAVSSDWLAEPLLAVQCLYPVSFVGAAHGDRKSIVATLREAGIEVACFGHGWPNGSVSMTEIPSIMRRSVISLNFSNSRGENQIKARTFEVPGSGGFLLTGQASGLHRYYRLGVDIAVFDGVDDLVGKVHHFLSHPDERDAIARSGFEHTRLKHTYEQRMAQVIEFALNAKMDSTPNMAPSFAKALAMHRVTLSLRMLRAVLLMISKLMFGAEKGPRAARRLVFELSWRLMGKRTFTAAGWPGRMFPRV
jgi:spore maturation protein CgeB